MIQLKYSPTTSDNSSNKVRDIIKHLFGVSDEFEPNNLELTQSDIKKILETEFDIRVKHQTINNIVRTSNYSLAWYDYTKKYSSGKTKNYHDKRNKKSKELQAVNTEGTSPVYEVNREKYEEDDLVIFTSKSDIQEHINKIKELLD